MVKIDKKIKIDFYNQQWVRLLDQAAYRGYHVSDLLSAIEKAEAKGESISIGYKSTGKAIHLTFGKHKLRLERIVKKKTPFTFSRLWHQIKMGCSSRYAEKHQARMERLAGLIEKKLQLDRIGTEKIPLIDAIIEGNLAKVQELITAGANIDITNKDGRTPLMVAAWRNQPAIAHALLEAGAAVNGVKDNFGSTPLMFAAQSGDIDLVSAMLLKDAAVNEENKNGATPLLFAVQSGNLELVCKFIEMGADINKQTERGGPLLMAAQKGNVEMVRKLIELGANVYAQDFEGTTIVDKVNLFRKKDFKEILHLVYAKAPELKIRGKEYKYRIQLAHAWHLDGKTHLPIQNISSEIPLEGGRESLWFHQMIKYLEKFSTLYPEKLEIATLLESAFEWAKYQHDYSHEQIADRIQLGLPTFLFAGFLEHAVVLFIWKNQVVICDRGGYSHDPIKIQTFEQESFTADIIKEIRSFNTRQAEEHKQFIHEELPIQIGSIQTRLDKALEGAAELAMQSVSNCSWVSSITAIYAMMLLSEVRGQADGKLLDELPDEVTRAERTKKSVDDFVSGLDFSSLKALSR